MEHEIDEDYEFRTAYLRGDDAVLLGYKFNKKTKSVDYYESTFPILEKKHKKLVRNTILSIPAEGKKLAAALILRSSGDNRTVFVTYTCPTNRKADGYSLDLQVIDAEGNTLNHVQNDFTGPSPYKVNAFLTNNGAVFIEELAQSGKDVRWGVGMVAFSSGVAHRYLTVTAAGKVVPVELTDNSREITNPCARMLHGKNDLDFEPEILYAPSNPAKTMSYGEYFDQLIKVTDDAVYFLMYRKSDNYIDKITE